MVSEGIDGFRWKRIDRVFADKRFHIFYIAVLWVFGAGACPEQALSARTLPGQPAIALSGENLLVDLVGHFCAGNSDLP